MTDAIDRPFKYEVEAEIITGHDSTLDEDWERITPKTKITGDLKIEFNEETKEMFVWTNKKQNGLVDISGVEK